jgi:hypothetical protein
MRTVVMKKLFKNYLLIALGMIVGGTAGYLYWKFAGCKGTCTITSSPFNSSLYGTITGGLLFSLFRKSKEKQNDLPANDQPG